MATEKILIFDEAGNAKRMKVRIARFLDNEPVTADDKTNIRTTLDVDDSLSGTFTTPLSVTSASDSSFSGGGDLNVSGGKTTLTNDSDNALVVETTNQNPMIVNVVGTAPNYLFDVRDDDTSKFRVDGSGRVGIGNSSPGSYDPAADDLVVGADGTGNRGLTIASGSANYGIIYFADGTIGSQQARGAITYNHTTDALSLGTAAVTRWHINSSGNLVANGAYGIDFGSVAGGTGTPDTTTGGLLDDFETGSFSPTFGTTGTGFTTVTLGVINARYTKIGNCVTFSVYLKTNEIDATGATGALTISGLPFTSRSDSGQYAGAVNVGYAYRWVNAPEGGYVVGTSITLTKRNSSITGSLSYAFPADLTSGVNSNYNEVMVSGHYYTA